MERLKTLIAKQPTYRLVILGIALPAITYVIPKYIGVIPGLAAMAIWFIVLGRVVGKSTATKVANGTISNVSFSTGVKTAVGSQAASLYKTLVGVLFDLVRALSTPGPTQSKK